MRFSLVFCLLIDRALIMSDITLNKANKLSNISIGIKTIISKNNPQLASSRKNLIKLTNKNLLLKKVSQK